MLLMPGKTCDDGIKFFDNMQWGVLNDRRNAIPMSVLPTLLR